MTFLNGDSFLDAVIQGTGATDVYDLDFHDAYNWGLENGYPNGWAPPTQMITRPVVTAVTKSLNLHPVLGLAAGVIIPPLIEGLIKKVKRKKAMRRQLLQQYGGF